MIDEGNVEIASDSAKLAGQYANLCRVPIAVYPHPREVASPPAVSTRARQGSDVVMHALGPPRYEKGSDLVLQAITLVRQRRPALPIAFVIQWNARVFDPSGKESVPGPALESDPKVEFIRRDLTADEYEALLASSDCLLLPYRREQYHARLSGIAVEAFQAGVPFICVSDTWLSDAIVTMGAGTAIREETPNAVADAIIAVAEQIEMYRSQARNRSSIAREAHSARAFVGKLCAGFSGADPRS